MIASSSIETFTDLLFKLFSFCWEYYLIQIGLLVLMGKFVIKLLVLSLLIKVSLRKCRFWAKFLSRYSRNLFTLSLLINIC